MRVSSSRGPIQLPDFLLGGVAKAGTTTVYRLLLQNPEVFLPEHKEPYFFSFRGPPDCAAEDLRRDIMWRDEDYLRLFEGVVANRVLGEASTSYFYTYKVTIPKLREWYGEQCRDLKIIGVLRNPIDRAFSHYLFLRRRGIESLPFAEAIRPQVVAGRSGERLWDFDYLNYGLYTEQVEAYLEAFPHCRFYLYEDLAKPAALYEDLCGFLGIASRVGIDTDIRANPSGVPRSRFLVSMITDNGWLKGTAKAIIPSRYHLGAIKVRDRLLASLVKKPELDPALRRELTEWYRQDVTRLGRILRRDLSGWLQQ